MGFVIFTLIITQLVFVGIPGITPYFPWAIPAICSGVIGPEIPPPGAVSYIILGFTSVLGLFGTAAWWRFADQT
jgi:ABC-2 type transport system permease protein